MDEVRMKDVLKEWLGEILSGVFIDIEDYDSGVLRVWAACRGGRRDYIAIDIDELQANLFDDPYSSTTTIDMGGLDMAGEKIKAHMEKYMQ